MRCWWTFLLLFGMLLGVAAAPAGAGLVLEAHAGFGGYYRPHTLLPIAVSIQNSGGTLDGEFRVTATDDRTFPYHYRVPVKLAGVAHQLRFLYVLPESFSTQITVEFWSNGQLVASSTDGHCQELYETDRLLVVVGGTGSSFNYLNSQNIDTGANPVPRAWDFSRDQQYNYQLRYGGPRGMIQPGMAPFAKGNLRLVYLGASQLPDNPEGYGSVAQVALMADTTENTLSADVQQALTMWVSTGGHLLIAGGGVPSRLAAPFFTRLHPTSGNTTTLPGVGSALTGSYGAGYLTWLSFDPDSVRTLDWKAAIAFYSKLVALDPALPMMVALRDAINQAVMVHNLRPPSLTLIVVFLLVYLVLLVPVNYFWLRKIDKREMAWLTTPAIVLLFTIGAYGIGYMTKGHSLVLNMVSLAEVGAGQTVAEATSELLIFSPARASYRLNLGDTGLLLREILPQENMSRRNTPTLASLDITTTEGKIEVGHVAVNMWDLRQFVTAHRLDLGKGITAKLPPLLPGARPVGAITNNSPYRFPIAKLFYNGALVANFSLERGTNDLQQTPPPVVSWPAEKQTACETIQNNLLNSQFNGNARLSRGYVLVAYTDEELFPVRLDNRAPNSEITGLVIHLDGQYLNSMLRRQGNVPLPMPRIKILRSQGRQGR